MAHRNPIAELLHKTKIEEVVAEQKQVFTVTNEDTIESAVTLIGNNKLLALPVLDKKSGAVLGVIDVTDIAQYVVSCAPNASAITAKDLDLNILKTADRAISLAPVKNVLRTARRSVLVSLYESSPLLEAVELFAQGVHRAIVFSHQKEVSKIISQSDVLTFLSHHLHQGHAKVLGHRTLTELGYGQCEIFTIVDTTTVWAALQKISLTGVSALAVVDAEGKLVGNFSASDLRALYNTQDFPHLASSVKDFLAKYSAASLKPITGDASKTLIDNVKILADNKLHHLWLVDGNQKPVGIFSLTDLASISIHASE